MKTLRQSWTEGYVLSVSTRVPVNDAAQAAFFDIADLHRFVDLFILLPFDAKSVENFNKIQPWNSIFSFVQANATENIGDYSLVNRSVLKFQQVTHAFIILFPII